MDNKDTLRKRLQGLNALAERGEIGEREAARKLLEKLCKKYDIHEEELSETLQTNHEFVFHNDIEHKLLNQLVDKIMPDREVYRYRSGKGSRNTLIISCTPAEAARLHVEFDFYKSLWDQELDLFFRAFIYKHEIFSKTCEPSEVPTADAETIKRLAALMIGMKDQPLYPELEEKSR